MEKILVAKIVKPQGIKGEVKCQIFTDLVQIFNGKIKDFNVENQKLSAEKVAVRVGFLYIKFKDINTREEAEKLRNKEIFMDKSILQENLEDEILIDDLIGLMICDENANLVGQIVDVENYGASDILTILEDNHEYQVPFIKTIFKTNKKEIFVMREEYNINKI